MKRQEAEAWLTSKGWREAPAGSGEWFKVLKDGTLGLDYKYVVTSRMMKRQYCDPYFHKGWRDSLNKKFKFSEYVINADNYFEKLPRKEDGAK